MSIHRGTKRFTLELPMDQYEFLRNRSSVTGLSVSALVRSFIVEGQHHNLEEVRVDYQEDPFYARQGSFDGSTDLSVTHDRYLYGRDVT